MSFAPPSVEKAIEFQNEMHPRLAAEDGQTTKKIPLCKSNMKDLGDLGLGTILYFRDLRLLSNAFFICFLLSLPLVALAVIQRRVVQFSVGMEALLITSLPNIFGDDGSGELVYNASIWNEDIVTPFCACASEPSACAWCLPDGAGPPNSSVIDTVITAAVNECGDTCWTIKRTYLAVGVVLLDILICMVLLFAFVHMRLRAGKAAKQYDQSAVTISDYSIVFNNVPKDAVDAKEYADFCSSFGPVSEVVVVKECNKQLKRLKKEEKTIQRLRGAIAQQGKGGSAKAELEKIKEKAGLNADGKALRAFVTFDSVSGAQECWKMLKGGCGKGGNLSFRGKSLKAEHAVDPDELIYENLEYSRCSRFLRRVCTSLVALLIIVIGFILVALGKVGKDLATEQLDTCYAPDFVNGTYCDVVWGTHAGVYPGGAARNISSPTVFDTPMMCEYNNVVQECTFDYVVSDVLALPTAMETCGLSDCGMAEPTMERCAGCACQELMSESVSMLQFFVFDPSNALSFFSSYSSLTQISGKTDYYHFCQPFFVQLLQGYAFVGLAVVIVVIINMVIKNTLRALARFEKHHSSSTQEIGLAVKIFVAQFLNTALILVIVNANVPIVSNAFKDAYVEALNNISSVCVNSTSTPECSSLGAAVSALRFVFTLVPFNGDFIDFTIDWYKVVQTAIMLTLIINIVIPMVPILVKWPLHTLKKCMKKGKAKTQEELNKLYLGPDFRIADRLGVNLMIVFAALLYSAGNALFYFIGALVLFLVYWIDKILVLRFYRKPRGFNESISRRLSYVLPWAVFIHLVFAMWTYSKALPRPALSAGMQVYVDNIPTIVGCQGVVVWESTYLPEFGIDLEVPFCRGPGGVGEGSVDEDNAFVLMAQEYDIYARLLNAVVLPSFVFSILVFVFLIVDILLKTVGSILITILCGCCKRRKGKVADENAAKLTFGMSRSRGMVVGATSYDFTSLSSYIFAAPFSDSIVSKWSAKGL